MRRANLPLWAWGVALATLGFFGVGLALLAPVDGQRRALESGVALVDVLERLESEAIGLAVVEPRERAVRLADCRAQVAEATRTAAGDPELAPGLADLSERLGRLGSAAWGEPSARDAVNALRLRASTLKAAVRRRNRAVVADLGRTWDGMQILLAAAGAIALGATALSWRDVRRRRLAEARLLQSERRYEEIYDRSPVAIVVWDPARRIVDWNRRAEGLFGWPRAEVEGDDLADRLVPGSRRAAVVSAMEALIRDGGTSIATLPVRTRLGAERTCEWHCSAVTGPDGRVASVISSALDITDRRRAEADAGRNEARYRRLFDSNIIGIIVGTDEGAILDANDALLAMIGYTRDDLREGRLRWPEITPPEYLPLDFRAIEELRAAGAATPYEKEYLRKDGSRVPILIGAARSVAGADGGGTNLGFVIDLTVRREAQRRARDAHTLLESIRRAQLEFIDAPDLPRAFDTLLGGVLALSGSEFGLIAEVLPGPDGTPRLATSTIAGIGRDRGLDAFERVGLLARVAATGRPLLARAEAWPDADGPIGEVLGLPFFRGDAVAGVIGLANRPGGYSEEDVALLEPLASTCASLVGAHRAESLRSRAEAELQASKEAAEAANSAKDRFLAVLSHELRTPLTPVLAAVSVARDDPDAPPAHRELCEMIRRNVELEARLIDDLLDITRIGRGLLRLEPAEVDAHALIREVLGICRQDVETAGLRVELDLRADPAYVEADPTRLQQVVWNLVKNAVKFTPAGGTITVRSRVVPTAADSRADAPGRLVVEVCDTGIGLDPADLGRIFDAFERVESGLRSRSGGLGLGLSISRTVVEMLGGRLTARSEGRDRGATFRIDLPSLAAPPPAPTPAAPASADADAPARPASVGLDILLVEDNRDTLHFLALLLGQAGHRVRKASRVDAAAAAIADGPIDLLISDIELPDGSGLEVVRALHDARGQGIPAIAMTGFGSDEDVGLSLEAGFLAHLTKPVDFRRLSAAIRDAVSVGSAP